MLKSLLFYFANGGEKKNSQEKLIIIARKVRSAIAAQWQNIRLIIPWFKSRCRCWQRVKKMAKK
jgi:hypothetical protein